MTMRRRRTLTGTWRIVAMDLWDADHIDLCGPGHMQLDRDGGHMAFGAVQISLDCHYGADTVHFTFSGHDEMTEISGDGDAYLERDGSITGEIRFHMGDEATFTARPWQIFRSLLERLREEMKCLPH